MKNGMAMPEMDGARRAATARRSATHLLRGMVCATALTLVGANAFAMTKDQAKRIYDRIAGVPATDAQISQMVATGSPSAANRRARLIRRSN